jgi:hypothetical protein
VLGKARKVKAGLRVGASIPQKVSHFKDSVKMRVSQFFRYFSTLTDLYTNADPAWSRHP